MIHNDEKTVSCPLERERWKQNTERERARTGTSGAWPRGIIRSRLLLFVVAASSQRVLSYRPLPAVQGFRHGLWRKGRARAVCVLVKLPATLSVCSVPMRALSRALLPFGDRFVLPRFFCGLWRTVACFNDVACAPFVVPPRRPAGRNTVSSRRRCDSLKFRVCAAAVYRVRDMVCISASKNETNEKEKEGFM